MLKFYHAPWSRGSGVLWLLEELAVDYELIHIDIRAEEGAPEWYRAIQPNKKVPAIEHDGVVITERAAITVYLADAFPQEGLAPVIGDPARGPYLSATVYCDSVFDPCISARAHGLNYRSNDYSFGLFEDMVAHLERRLTASLRGRQQLHGGRHSARIGDPLYDGALESAARTPRLQGLSGAPGRPSRL
jgi:glutathione S-transferase